MDMRLHDVAQRIRLAATRGAWARFAEPSVGFRHDRIGAASFPTCIRAVSGLSSDPMSPRIFLLSALLCPVISFADDVPAAGGKPGHSTHGEAFDEGPRQAAVLMKGMGDVSFPITSAN